jgi:hypothetical protein
MIRARSGFLRHQSREASIVMTMPVTAPPAALRVVDERDTTIAESERTVPAREHYEEWDWNSISQNHTNLSRRQDGLNVVKAAGTTQVSNPNRLTARE